MSYFKSGIGICVLAGLLSACSVFHHHDSYRLAQKEKAVNVPNDLSHTQLHDYYPLPKQSAPAVAGSVSLIPPGSALTTETKHS